MGTRIASFIGWSDTGKTGFIALCIAALTGRGLKVGAVKRARHASGREAEGKDSTLFHKAGADAALIAGGDVVRVSREPPEWDRAFTESLFPDADAILIEGKLVAGAVRVIVGGRAETEPELKKPLAGFDVIITDKTELAETARSSGLAVYGPGEAARFVDDYLTGGIMEDRDLSVTTGGVEVPLAPFVRETIESVVLGVLKPLKKTNLDAEIVIRIGPKKG